MSTAFDSLPREVQDALLRGKQLEAVHLLRKAKGIALKAAQARVEAAVRQGLPAAPTAPPSVPPTPQPLADTQPGAALVVSRLLRLLRERAASRARGTSPGSDSVEKRSSGLAPGEQPRSDPASTITWLLLALLFAYFLFESQ